MSDGRKDYMTVFRRLTENLIRLAGAKDDVSRRHEDKKGKCEYEGVQQTVKECRSADGLTLFYC